MKKLSFIPLLLFLLINIQCGGGGDRTYSGTTPVTIKVTEVTEGTGSGAEQLSELTWHLLLRMERDQAGS
jgi:hypothetical protein